MLKPLVTVCVLLTAAAWPACLAAAEEQPRRRPARPAVEAKPAPNKPVRKPAAKPAPPKAKPAAEADLGSLEEMELGLFSENETEFGLLSGNKPAICSGKRAGLLSGNTARLVSRVNVLSGIKFNVNITIQNSGNKPGADALFGSLDRDGDGQLSPDEFRQALQKRAAPASF
jgi:hypothetical protein